jgi:AhpD family alkylhydroperoxidase
MEPRLDYVTAAPEAYKAMLGLKTAVSRLGIDHALLELIKIRASQINGCAFCLDMHTRDARKHGETEERIYQLSAWHESPAFTARERAALGWTDALTLIAETHAPDHVYDEARRHFSDQELVNLTLAVVTINAWNRLAVGFRRMPDLVPPNRS